MKENAYLSLQLTLCFLPEFRENSTEGLQKCWNRQTTLTTGDVTVPPVANELECQPPSSPSLYPHPQAPSTHPSPSPSHHDNHVKKPKNKTNKKLSRSLSLSVVVEDTDVKGIRKQIMPVTYAHLANEPSTKLDRHHPQHLWLDGLHTSGFSR